ncbi:MAG: hypothetical protein R3220_06065, partial [Balneolaceae bacterium]|nr:hypothetical protein [Balneolaceae bacterium]
ITKSVPETSLTPKGSQRIARGQPGKAGCNPGFGDRLNQNPRQEIATRSNRYRRVGQVAFSGHIAQAPFCEPAVASSSAELSGGNIPEHLNPGLRRSRWKHHSAI